MIQIFWLIDFLGLFLGRLILSFFLFQEYRQRKNSQKILAFLYLILSLGVFFAYYSSFVFIFLIFLELFLSLKEFIKEKKSFKELEPRFLRIALAIVFLFVGPGSLSLDRLWNIRF